MQLWRKYLTNTKVSFVENNAECARRHKAEIEAVAKGRVYVGGSPVKSLFMLSQRHSCPVMLEASARNLPSGIAHPQLITLWSI